MSDTYSSAWNNLRGIEGFSLCDWPGHPSCVLFFGGCNMRCPTCHNAGIAWTPERFPALFPADVRSFLKKRADWLDGVVITGGEATLEPDLPRFVEEVAAYGVPVKIDTNGMRPDVVAEILAQDGERVFAVDVKGPWHKYPVLTGKTYTPEEAQENLQAIFRMAENHPDSFYFRLTKVPFLSEEDICTARSYLPSGFSLTLQEYVPPGRTYAEADQEARRVSGNVVDGTHSVCDSQGSESEWGQGSVAFEKTGPEGRRQTR